MVFAFLIFEIGKESDNGGCRTQLGETGEKNGSIYQYARQAHLFLRQIMSKDEKSGHKANGHAEIVHQRSFNALLDNDAHLLLFIF